MEKKHVCIICTWEYKQEEGCPEQNIPPGTPFEDLPDTFYCPVCMASKADFS